MRKLGPGSKPQVLTDNEQAWTAEFMTDPDAPFTHYKKKAIKDALLARCHDKCAYCEDYFSGSFEEVEHIKPKKDKRFMHLVVDWDNLTMACRRCNGSKLQKWDDAHPFVHVYNEDPEDHISFRDGIPVPITPRGKTTIDHAALDRAELVKQRTQVLRDIALCLHAAADDPAMGAGLKKLFEREHCGEGGRFSTCVKQFLATRP